MSRNLTRDHQRNASQARWSSMTPDQRRAATQKARLTHAVNEIARNFDKLSDEQRAAISEAMAKGGGPR